MPTLNISVVFLQLVNISSNSNAQK